MRHTRLFVQGTREKIPERYRTGVSLHSHTLHSKESLDFIYHASRHSALLRYVLRRGDARYRACHGGAAMDLRKGWWTPPLAPLEAYEVEADQLRSMGCTPIVSLTDHDDIEAPISLQAVGASRDVPVSVEWTVPYGPTFFHIGMHNFAAQGARAVMARLQAFTASPDPAGLCEVLADLDADPAVLIVFNHPLWDEKGIGAELHRQTVARFLTNYGEYMHAFEINGLRPWSENRAVLRLAAEWAKPSISGGDRHILEPNATVNLTNAATFAEFAQEVRRDGHSYIAVRPQYREAHASRIFHNMLDVFRTYEGHGRGWTEWSDRVFFTQESGEVASLTQLFGENPPAPVAMFAGFMRLAGSPGVRNALRSVTPSTAVALD